MKILRLFPLIMLGLWVSSCESDADSNIIDQPSSPDEREWLLTKNIELSSEEKNIVAGLNEFSYGMMRESSSNPDAEGFCISSLSAAIQLGMLANASDGDLRSEIMNAIKVDDMNRLNVMFEKLMHYLPCEDAGSSLSISNQFWVKEGITVPAESQSLLSKVFNAGIDYVDFKKEEAMLSINEWANINTRGKIQRILDGNWRQYTDLQMLNANIVYFKGDWSWKFNKDKTVLDTFHSPSGDMEVEMMYRAASTSSYSENDLLQYITVAFEGCQNIMELYLPKDGVSLSDIITALNPEMQKNLNADRKMRDTVLKLPKFKSEMSVDLTTVLNNLGIKSLSNADMSPMGLGMLPSNPFQKTSIKIDEDGAELAACTAILIGAGALTEDDPIILNFNHPFLYIIRNVATNAILMAGTVTDPR